MRDVSVATLSGAVVTRWRVEDHIRLVLSVRGQGDEVHALCNRCQRGHWITREHVGEGGRLLIATCHACGTRVELALEGARAPN